LGNRPDIACVIYAAKSTEDRRGSIATQLADCRTAIDVADERVIVAEYRDEAVSAYTSNRGPGLESAMGHVAELARLYRGAELWVQHSDRLARGDGKTARHVVEVALWANKAEVTICSLQDPDTFRDLLYAVVTGQRNHLDSQRKGAAVAAGLRRTVDRGVYAGICLDGYRVVVEVDQANVVTKRLEIDPVRAPLIRMIFAMALEGHNGEQIAAAVTAAGWRTPRPGRDGRPVRIEAPRDHPCIPGLGRADGEIPLFTEWDRATPAHPHASMVHGTFGSWRAGLLAAGYSHSRPRKQPPARERDALGRYK
jgi:DNA invertase Pin-like site-specific DNA recombinase